MFALERNQTYPFNMRWLLSWLIDSGTADVQKLLHTTALGPICHRSIHMWRINIRTSYPQTKKEVRLIRNLPYKHKLGKFDCILVQFLLSKVKIALIFLVKSISNRSQNKVLVYFGHLGMHIISILGLRCGPDQVLMTF